MEARIKELESRLLETSLLLGKHQAELQHWKPRAQELQNELSELKNKSEHLEQALINKNHTLAQSNQLVERIYQTKSWKLTRPLSRLWGFCLDLSSAVGLTSRSALIKAGDAPENNNMKRAALTGCDLPGERNSSIAVEPASNVLTPAEKKIYFELKTALAKKNCEDF